MHGQANDNEIYLLIKHIRSVLPRVAKRLSYIQDARCLKVNLMFKWPLGLQHSRKWNTLFYDNSSKCMATYTILQVKLKPLLWYHIHYTIAACGSEGKPPCIQPYHCKISHTRHFTSIQTVPGNKRKAGRVPAWTSLANKENIPFFMFMVPCIIIYSMK